MRTLCLLKLLLEFLMQYNILECLFATPIPLQIICFQKEFFLNLIWCIRKQSATEVKIARMSHGKLKSWYHDTIHFICTFMLWILFVKHLQPIYEKGHVRFHARHFISQESFLNFRSKVKGIVLVVTFSAHKKLEAQVMYESHSLVDFHMTMVFEASQF